MASEKIGRYDKKSELGRGGMATVYHAYDPSFEREVAIKVLPQAFLHDPQFRVRFQREAKMIALLEHPAIVPVYDFGEDHEQPYIVMRYMAGGSLAERVKAGPIDPIETARIISRLAPALDAAHARGIVHRDLKPGNILFDQYGNAFLSDFGIARLVQEGSATLTGNNIVGTPAYMSPEQVQGEKNIDGRSDIYALGVLVFQMLTEQFPYQADTPAKMMMMHILEPVPHILQRKGDVPAGVDAVLSTAMAKDPADRYASSGEMAAALEAAVHGALPTRYTSSPVPSETRILEPIEVTSINAGQTVVRPTESVAGASKTGASTPPPGQAPAEKAPSQKRSKLMMAAVPLLLVLCLGSLATAGIMLGKQPGGLMAMLGQITTTPTLTAPAEATNTTTAALPVVLSSPTVRAVLIPSQTSEPPTFTPTSLPTDTPTPEPSLTPAPTQVVGPPVIGGADKIAFIINNEINVANLDGTGLRKLTQDGSTKMNLQWSPDGSAVIYLVGKCVKMVLWETGEENIIACFNYVQYLEEFQISPDGKQVAISLDRELYILPYDLEQLGKVKVRSDLVALGECKSFLPYTRNKVKELQWSFDSQLVAIKILIPLDDGRLSENIQVIHIDRCIPNPLALDNFPVRRFFQEMKGYLKTPTIQNFSWDGYSLFVLGNQVRNDGYGDMFIYNMELHKAYLEVNPVGGTCCYRDSVWSPDGTHLAFAYQDMGGGAASITQIYLVPYGTIGTGVSYTPLSLPEITNSKEKPQIALRRAP